QCYTCHASATRATPVLHVARQCYNQSMTVEILEQALSNILKDFPEIELVYLFGSQVHGNIGPLSDYDIGIVENAPHPLSTHARFQHRLAQLLDTDKIDVVLLDQAPIELAYHVIARGRLLYKIDQFTHVEFEARILGLYGDYLPVLQMFRKEIQQGDPDGKRVQRYREALGRTQRTLSKIRNAPAK
ncbi:MAG TPA: nucleotidyltransferase domain-containing protein, partial [Levilinea sp.]|nr:nucleotidyltransferase domain-containing protein [Levilinea sp.]